LPDKVIIMRALAVEEQETSPIAAGETGECSPIPPYVHFYKKGPHEQLLVASVKPNSDYPAGIAISTVHDWIRAQGYDNWLLNSEQISLLAREIRKLDNAKEYTIAERKDCTITIQTAPDRLHAWVNIIPAYGGVPLTASLLAEALEKKNIHFGINEEVRTQILQEGQCERLPIAEGIPPIQGEPAKFEHLVHESETRGIPQEKDHGRVDYKELGLFLSVSKDTPLLKRIPPAAGTPGRAIDGTEILAPPGPDRPLKPGPGTAISPDDPNIVIATRGGTPEYDGNYVRIESTLEIEGINPSTGNINYDGNLVITGPVEPGFKVKASLDLTIWDTVEGSDLTAGKNLILMTGVYGRGKTRITVEGHLEARFLSECIVRCNGNIDVADSVAHCTIECGGSIYLGKTGGKGQIVGGKISALREIQAQILGSVSEIPTTIGISAPQDLLLQNVKLEKDIAEIRMKLEPIESKHQSQPDKPEKQQDPAGIKLQETMILLEQKLAFLEESHSAIKNKMALVANGRIKASEAHRGVVLMRAPHRKIIEDYSVDIIFQPPPEETPPKDTTAPAKENNPAPANQPSSIKSRDL
jgi:uncharacterized protein